MDGNDKIEFTDYNKQYLTDNSSLMTIHEMSHELNVSTNVIGKWLKELGIKKKVVKRHGAGVNNDRNGFFVHDQTIFTI